MDRAATELEASDSCHVTSQTSPQPHTHARTRNPSFTHDVTRPCFRPRVIGDKLMDV